LHIAATISASGVILFQFLVAVRLAEESGRLAPVLVAKALDSKLRLIFWISLGAAFLSGIAWFFSVAAGITDLSMIETFTDRATWSILTETQFGSTWMIRIFVGALLGLSMLLTLSCRQRGSLSAFQATLAIIFLGSLAWAGHAAATPGLSGHLLLTADFLHLAAAGAWLGGLVPLALLLSMVRRRSIENGNAIAIAATKRFSVLGILSVGTLVGTGTVNAWNLVGSVSALAETDYGHLLVAKVALFLAMLCFAAFNRQYITPRMALGETTKRLEQNAYVEVTLGIVIIILVGALGTLAPGSHVLSAHLH
jgi:putative copper resistance protein D